LIQVDDYFAVESLAVSVEATVEDDFLLEEQQSHHDVVDNSTVDIDAPDKSQGNSPDSCTNTSATNTAEVVDNLFRQLPNYYNLQEETLLETTMLVSSYIFSKEQMLQWTCRESNPGPIMISFRRLQA